MDNSSPGREVLIGYNDRGTRWEIRVVAISGDGFPHTDHYAVNSATLARAGYVPRATLDEALRSEAEALDFVRKRTKEITECTAEDAAEKDLAGLLDMLALEVNCEWERAEAAQRAAELLNTKLLALAGDDVSPGFGVDPSDSAALESLRQTIDDHLLWTSDEASEAGDYEACVRYSGELAREGKALKLRFDVERMRVENLRTLVEKLKADLRHSERLADELSDAAYSYLNQLRQQRTLAGAHCGPDEPGRELPVSCKPIKNSSGRAQAGSDQTPSSVESPAGDPPVAFARADAQGSADGGGEVAACDVCKSSSCILSDEECREACDAHAAHEASWVPKIKDRVRHKKSGRTGTVVRPADSGPGFVVLTDEPFCGVMGLLADGFFATADQLEPLPSPKDPPK